MHEGRVLNMRTHLMLVTWQPRASASLHTAEPVQGVQGSMNAASECEGLERTHEAISAYDQNFLH